MLVESYPKSRNLDYVTANESVPMISERVSLIAIEQLSRGEKFIGAVLECK